MTASPEIVQRGSSRREPSFERRGRLARQAAAIPAALLFLLPLWLMLVGSLRPLGQPPPLSVRLVPDVAGVGQLRARCSRSCRSAATR